MGGGWVGGAESSKFQQCPELFFVPQYDRSGEGLKKAMKKKGRIFRIL